MAPGQRRRQRPLLLLPLLLLLLLPLATADVEEDVDIEGVQLVNDAVKKMVESGSPFNAYLKLLQGEVKCGISSARSAYAELVSCYETKSREMDRQEKLLAKALRKTEDCRMLLLVDACMRENSVRDHCLTEKSKDRLEEEVGKDAKELCNKKAKQKQKKTQ